MKQLLSILAIAILLTACGNRQRPTYNVNVTLNGTDTGTVSVYVVDTVYQKLRCLGKQKIDKKTPMACFRGAYDYDHIAFVKLAGDTNTWYFVLDNKPIELSVGKKYYSVSGESVKTRNAMSLCQRVEKIAIEKQNLAQRFDTLAADTAFTQAQERRMRARYTLLSDSIQHILQQSLTTATPPEAFIIRNRCGKFLPKE